MVAITFDDGPGPYTPSVLRILERSHIPATFFQLGGQISGREHLLRRMLRDGHALANHSYNHANLAGGGPAAYRQLAATSGRIRGASGYTPCLFRPPYGAVSGSLVSEALRLDMLTIIWDVDPRDWSRPGAGAIRARVLGGVRPGSIVLLHDAGGPREQTVGALPGIIARLRARGYRFVTVPELLSLREIYG
jgi:peptidoglycan/xylan/chitin deacetylase (PgdA/CDA1 family)